MIKGRQPRTTLGGFSIVPSVSRLRPCRQSNRASFGAVFLGKHSRLPPRKGTSQHAATSQQQGDSIPYEIIVPASKQSPYELRLYQPRYIVEMAYKNRAAAYMEFDKYLTGSNEDQIHLSAFSPVLMRHDPFTPYVPGSAPTIKALQGTKVMQMFVRSLGSLPEAGINLTEEPPTPLGDQLSLNIAGGEMVAAMSFSGQATKDASLHVAESLRNLLAQDRVSLASSEQAGLFSIAQFDPVHSLRERTNELWLAVAL